PPMGEIPTPPGQVAPPQGVARAALRRPGPRGAGVGGGRAPAGPHPPLHPRRRGRPHAAPRRDLRGLRHRPSVRRRDRLGDLPQPGDPMTDTTIRFLTKSSATPLPTRAHAEDAGWDLRAAEAATVPSGAIRLVPTGIYVDLPPGT